MTWLKERRSLLLLLLLSCSALFWELSLIRWVPGSVRVVGYFTNLVLIAAFLGLGSGAILSRFQLKLFDWWPVTFFLLALLSLVFGALSTPNPPGEAEFFWVGGPFHGRAESIGWLSTLDHWLWKHVAVYFRKTSFYVVISLLFLLTAVHFAFIGHRIGLLFKELPPLRAYGYDLGGSLAGVLLFAGASVAATPPIVWFVAGVVGLGSVTSWRGLGGLLRAILAVCALLLVFSSGSRYLWSPYYKIEITEIKNKPKHGPPRLDGYQVRVNNDYHQTALNLSDERLDGEFVYQWRTRYDAPYREHQPGDVLVVGAGMGNDVQAALRNGASRVVAVEIDPELLRLGQALHPERPYSDPRVERVVDDARSYIKRCDRRFDTVIFGFLDSHTLMSSFSTLRIDNYVYTVQSMIDTIRLLKPGGRVAVSFASVRDFIARRIYLMLKTALGGPVHVERLPPYGHLFRGARPARWQPPSNAWEQTQRDDWLPTDDWPFLYLKEPSIPTHYLFFMLIVVVFGLISFGLIERGRRRINLQFFFLGAGFMLLETRSITEIALLFGSTWVVNAIAIGAILLAVWAANWTVIRWKQPPVRLLYLAIVICLALGNLIQPGTLYVPSLLLRLALVAVVVFSPIFLAGLVFSSQFRHADHPNLLFGSNLLGAMVGGAVEYFSLIVGLSPLYLVGGVLYLLAFLFSLRRA
jgi:SAM-dependent methyltransferase